MKDQSFNRPLAVITGASSGIGFELAQVFANHNFDLIIAAEDPGIFLAAGALRELGGQVEVVQADLSQKSGVEKLYARIQMLNRSVDSVCMNAGVGICGEFAHTDLITELNIIQLNIVSLLHLTKLLLPDFIHQGHGRILYTSSVAASMPGPYFAVYAASKAFVQSFAEALRAEVQDKGIVVTALQPGATDTNFFDRAHMFDTKAGVGKKDDPAVVAKDGFDALMAGKDHVVAGSFKNKIQTSMAKFMSQPQAAKIQGQDVKPGSAEKH